MPNYVSAYTGTQIDANLAKINNITIDPDNTLSANSDTKLPTQKAVKGYVDNFVGIAGYSTTQISTSPVNSLPSTSQGLIDEMVVKGRTTVNLLTDSVAGGESTSGWTLTNGTLATDTTNKLEGTNCLKFIRDAVSTVGYAYRDILSLLTAGKYYLISANYKNGNLTGTGVRLRMNLQSDASVINSGLVTGTSYNRNGIIIQPTDFDTATVASLQFEFSGANTEYGYFDALQLQEITATDYALGVPALLDKYTWHLGVKSVDKMRVKSVGKNLFDKREGLAFRTNGYVEPVALTISTVADYYTFRVKVKPNTVYRLKRQDGTNLNTGIQLQDSQQVTTQSINGFATSSISITTTSTTSYIVFHVFKTVLFDANVLYQLEESASATTYEPYQQSQSVCPLPLRAVPSIADTWDSVRGKHVQNVSDWVTLSGNAFTWNFNADYTAFKEFNISTQSDNARIGYLLNKYNNNKTLVYDTTPSESDTYVVGNYINITASDTDTGWLEAWVLGTTFTGLTWGNLIKAYMNGWKLTTANVNVASCVWTGIASGTTKSGASGYTDVTTTIDTGFTPYKMLYQLATPITTYLQPSVLQASANGTIYQEHFVEDYGFYNSGLALTDSTKLITNLVEVRKWNINDGSYIIIPNSSVTLTSGVITAITSAVNGEFYTFDYNYDDSLSLNGELNYSYAVNIAGQTSLNTENILTLDSKVESIDKTIKAKSYMSSLALGAISATTTFICFIAPRNCILTGINLVTRDAITADNTNYWTITALNKGANGAGAGVIATKNTTIATGQGFVAYDTWSIGALSSSANSLVQGDVVILSLTKSASATAFAEAYATIEYV